MTGQIDNFYVIRMPNGEYLKKANFKGSSLSVPSLVDALRFHSLEEAEGYISQYLHRDASCLGIMRITLTAETVRESCIG